MRMEWHTVKMNGRFNLALLVSEERLEGLLTIRFIHSEIGYLHSSDFDLHVYRFWKLFQVFQISSRRLGREEVM